MMAHYDEMLLKIQEGDVITSKKGTISQHSITKEWFLIKKFKYLGKGCLSVIGDKEPVNVTQYSNTSPPTKVGGFPATGPVLPD